jgi:hypothetical protein
MKNIAALSMNVRSSAVKARRTVTCCEAIRDRPRLARILQSPHAVVIDRIVGHESPAFCRRDRLAIITRPARDAGRLPGSARLDLSVHAGRTGSIAMRGTK